MGISVSAKENKFDHQNKTFTEVYLSCCEAGFKGFNREVKNGSFVGCLWLCVRGKMVMKKLKRRGEKERQKKPCLMMMMSSRFESCRGLAIQSDDVREMRVKKR